MLSPFPDESLREFNERLNMTGTIDYTPLVQHFGLNESSAKAMFLCSEAFNAQFAYDQWCGRRTRAANAYGARNWLKRKYLLDDATADEISAKYEQREALALLDHCRFEDFANTLVTQEARDELASIGVL